VVNPGELAVRLEKGWIARNSLVQQIGCLQQIPSGLLEFQAITRFLARL
jgi:hypothetical protein